MEHLILCFTVPGTTLFERERKTKVAIKHKKIKSTIKKFWGALLASKEIARSLAHEARVLLALKGIFNFDLIELVDQLLKYRSMFSPYFDADLKEEVCPIIAYGTFMEGYEEEAIVLPMLGKSLDDALIDRKNKKNNDKLSIDAVGAIVDQAVHQFILNYM